MTLGSQLFFWTSAWQKGERIAERELAARESRTFTTASDAIHWLLTPEDE